MSATNPITQKMPQFAEPAQDTFGEWANIGERIVAIKPSVRCLIWFDHPEVFGKPFEVLPADTWTVLDGSKNTGTTGYGILTEPKLMDLLKPQGVQKDTIPPRGW